MSSTRPPAPLVWAAATNATASVTTSGPAAAPAVTSNTPRKINSRLAKALEDLKRTLTRDQKANFQACSKEDVEAAIKSIQERLGSQRRLAYMQRLSKFIDLVGQLTIAGGDFICVNGPSNFLWAPLRHALEKVGEDRAQGRYLDKLVEILSEIGDILPQLNDYQALFARHSDVILILDDYREAILKFHTGLMEVFNKPAWKSMFDSSWGRFSKITDDTKQTLLRIRKLLDDAKATASMREIQALRDQITQESQLAASRDDEASKERRRVQLQEIANKLAAPQYIDDQSDTQKRTHESARGDWLFRNERFARWANVGDEAHRVLDLNGCPGAGKTFLVSNVVRHLQEVQAKSVDSISLAYFFFKHDSQSKAKAVYTAALRALIEQLVNEEANQTLLDHAFRLLSTVNAPSKDCLAELASTAVRAKRLCFLVLDGLDECEPADQNVLLRWLKDLISSSGEIPFTLRILLSGRREEYLEKEIATFPDVSSVRVDAADAHELCIRLYTEERAQDIQKSFNADDTTRKTIVTKVTSKARGMFLFAHVVLQHLRDLPTLKELRGELREGTFPSGLDAAYNRVAIQVLGGHPSQSSSTSRSLSSRQAMAKQLLSWISCATRPLYWREIQARFMIDLQDGPQDDAYEGMTRYSPKQLCGCFVDISESGSESEKTVHIVHRTATEYLQEMQKIPSTTEQHLEMLSFCCQYLNSDPFVKPTTAQIRQKHARTGYYAFQDYAAAHWWDHATALASCKQLEQRQENPQIVADLSRLPANYSRSSANSKHSQGTSISHILAKLDPSGSERNKVLFFEHQISMTREAVVSVQEEAAASRDGAFSARMDHIYGQLRHKCPKPWCSEFHQGFKSQTQFQRHNNAHDRPFRCLREGCAVAPLGLESKNDLRMHDKRFHAVEKASLFEEADNPRVPWRKRLSRAINDGSLERVKAIILPAGERVVLAREVLERARGNVSNCPPLVEAVRSGHLDICEYLLEAGAEVNKGISKTHITPLREAIAANDHEIFGLLLRQYGADPIGEPSEWPQAEREKHRLSEEKYDTLGFALACSSIGFILPLLSKADLAASQLFGYLRTLVGSRAPGRDEIVSLLRKSELGFGSTKCDEGRSLLSFAAEKNSIDVMELILAAGSDDIDKRCSRGMTPLMYAARAGSTAAVRTILACDGVSPNIACEGRNAYSYAAEADHADVLKTLFEAQFPGVNQPCNFNKTPLLYAAGSGSTAAVRTILADNRGATGTPDNHGRNAYAYAAEEGYSNVLEALIEAQFPGINQRCNYGKTPLLYASGAGMSGRGSAAAVQTILACGLFVPGSSSGTGRTAYSYAAQACRLDVLEALYAGQCPGIDEADMAGMAPIEYAREKGNAECVQWFLATGAVGGTRVDASHKADQGGRESSVQQPPTDPQGAPSLSAGVHASNPPPSQCTLEPSSE